VVARHPEWALGYEDEVWWSRLAHPCLSAWSDDGQPLRLVEQTVAKDDPDPKALACYGLLVRWADPLAERLTEQMWLRFVQERPVSAVTTQFLDWCCDRLGAAGKTAFVRGGKSEDKSFDAPSTVGGLAFAPKGLRLTWESRPRVSTTGSASTASPRMG